MVLFCSLLLILVSVAFFTLLERKVLAYIMLRKGPNKPSMSGWFVPFADAAKLLTKVSVSPLVSSSFAMSSACFLLFIVPALTWCFMVLPSSAHDFSLSMLCLLVLMSLSIFGLLLSGWGSNSKYAILGATRCVAQCISYEVCLILLFFCFALFKSMEVLVRCNFWSFLFMSHVCLIFFIVCLAETNRSPFDFAEGESELVSGYNVEFSGPKFVILFLAEYMSILFLSFLCGCLYSDGFWLNSIFGCLFIAFAFIWVRGTIPRFRYDQLMYLSWKSLLPLLLAGLTLSLLL